LDENSLSKEASDSLRKCKSTFQKALKEAKAPYQITCKSRAGYVLSPVKGKSQTSHKKSR